MDLAVRTSFRWAATLERHQPAGNPTNKCTMRTIRNYVTPLVAMGAVAAAIAAAPTAAAASVPTCVSLGASATQ